MRGNRYQGHAIGTAVTIGDGYDPERPNETIGGRLGAHYVRQTVALGGSGTADLE
jgi:hypothetical protein